MQGTVAQLILDQKGKGFHEAFAALNSAASAAERQSKAKDKNIASQARATRADLGRAMFWFHHCQRADGTNDTIWNALKVLSQDFVDRGILKPEAMNWF